MQDREWKQNYKTQKRLTKITNINIEIWIHDWNTLSKKCQITVSAQQTTAS